MTHPSVSNSKIIRLCCLVVLLGACAGGNETPGDATPPQMGDSGAPADATPPPDGPVGDPCEGVDCSAMSDMCNTGVCDSNTGACVAEPLVDGTGCDDGDLCTAVDACTAGACSGAATDCSEMSDLCNAGVCNPVDGACTTEAREDGTMCDDGDLCTMMDQCTGGGCAGAAVDCSAMSDMCNAGVCNPADGMCMTMVMADGTMCDDGDLCTVSDECTAGSCGGSPMTCPAVPGATSMCTGGVCGFTCLADLGDCNADAADGCETDLTTTVAHCGMCGMLCPTPMNASPTCTGSTCGFTCNAGFADCDGAAANGCEVELATDPSNCGMCGTVCSSPTTCVSGFCSGICRPGAPRILVYNPGGTVGTSMLGSSTAVITVASDAMWRSMTTDEFGGFDIIWIDGARCGGSLSSVYGLAEDTVSAWGPAVRGRIVLVTGDPDLHGGTMAQRFYRNSAAWLGENGANAEGGRTSLFFSWGCTLVNSPGYSAGARGTPERFASALGSPITGTRTNFCRMYTTTAGASHPVLAGVTSYWGCPSHGGLPTIPSTYVTLSTGTSGGAATIAARESPMPCVSAP